MVVIFHIDLSSSISMQNWQVVRSLEDFKILNHKFVKGFLDLPNTVFVSPSSEQDVIILRVSLQNYLQELISRADVMNSQHLKVFLELENHCPSYMQFQPMLLNEISDEMEVSDIYFCKSQQLLFTGMAYSSSSGRLSSYLNSISSLWNNSYLGALGIYHLAKSSYGELHIQKIFHQDLPSQVSRIKFIEEEDLIILGLFDGSLCIYKLFTRDPSSKDKNLLEFYGKMKPHSSKILNFEVISNMGYLYSAASKENFITISEINYQSVISSFTVSQHNISTMSFDKDYKKIFVTNINKSLYIIQIENYIHLNTVAIIHENTEFLTTTVISDYSHILAGGQGYVRFYDWEENNRNYHLSLQKIISLGNLKVNQILYDSSKSNVYLALSNGSVMLFSHSLSPEFVLDYHDKAVNRIIFDEESRTLFTCSADKEVKIWQIPSEWPSEVMRVDKEYNQKCIIEDHSVSSDNIMKIQDAFKDLDFREEENQNILKNKSTDNTQDESNLNVRKKETNIHETDYYEDEIISCDDLDGWDEDQPLEPLKLKNNEAFYDFMGI